MSASSSCPHFDRCSSPLCPLDLQSLEHGVWFGDEETCHRRDLHAPWVERQRKIARASGGDFSRGAFTVAMLEHPCIIGSAFRGLDPNAGPISEERVRKWLSEHPAITDADRARRVAQGQKRAAISGGFDGRRGRFYSARETIGAETVSVAGRAQV